MSIAIDTRASSGMPSNRLVSLDVLRGITIAFLILVNNGIYNYAYPALEHAEWNGWTPTDLVFPAFLFLVGVTIVFSFESRTLPALRTTLLGMLTGMWLRSKRSATTKARGMLAAGILGIFLGLLRGHWFPINKNLWTSSYVLFAAGVALVAFAICYWAIDIKNWKKGWTYIWLVFGMNVITVYVFAELLASTIYAIHIHTGTRTVSLSWDYFLHSFAEIPSHHLASLAHSISIVAICFVPAVILYRKRIFLKV